MNLKEHFRLFIKNLKYKPDYYNNSLLPAVVEINLTQHCNRNCSFCPNSEIKNKNEMSFLNFVKIIEQLEKINYKGIVSFCGFGEPLCHKSFKNVIGYTHENLKDCKIHVISNGLLLDDKILDFMQSRVNLLEISCYEEKDHDKFLKLKNKYKFISIRKRWNLDFINNRGGFFKSKNSDYSLYNTCYYPFYTVFIDINLDVLACAHDFNKNNIIGNINKENLLDVWNNSFMKRAMYNSERKTFCKDCDVKGTMVGKSFYKLYGKNK